MKLQVDERIIKVYRHHFAFFITRSLTVWAASIPFYFIAALLSMNQSLSFQFFVHVGITALFVMVNIYDLLIYYLDSLIITSKRIVYLNWINPFRYDEKECGLDDIQDIETQENGLLSKIPLFDFGKFTLETASTRTAIKFEEAPDPEAIKYFIVNVARSHVGTLQFRPKLGGSTSEFINKTEKAASKLEKK